MPGTQKLAQAIENMTQSLDSVKADGLALSEMMSEFSRAIEAYKQYQAYVSGETMDVKEVRIENGILIEVEYKWQDM